MKKIMFFWISILIFSCNPIEKNTPKTEAAKVENSTTVESFDWLLGDWFRLNEKEGKETFETWKKINEREYAGIGYTMQNDDTIQQENMSLRNSKGTWDLLVSLDKEDDAVDFIGTSLDKNEFTVENKENEFPKKIKYWIEGQTLKATISNAELSIHFEFEKLKK